MKIRGNTVGTNIKPEKVLVKSENLNEEEKAIARANIGAAAVVCVHFDSTMEASMNAAEIYEAQKKGDSVVLVGDDNFIYHPLIISQEAAIFGSVGVLDDSTIQYIIMIDSNGGCTTQMTTHKEDCRIDDTSVGNNAWSSNKITIEITNAAEKAVKTSSARAAEAFCPECHKIGRVVEFVPLRDEPVYVTGYGSVQSVTVLGKNLYDQSKYPANISGYVAHKSGDFAESANYNRTGYIPVAHLAGKTITLNYPPTGSNPGMAFYSRLPDGTSTDSRAAYISGGVGTNIKVPDNAQYMAFSVAAENVSKGLQIELGSKATDFKSYKEKTIQLRGGDINIREELYDGWNTIAVYSDGEVLVQCREDIVAIVTRLREALG